MLSRPLRDFSFVYIYPALERGALGVPGYSQSRLPALVAESRRTGTSKRKKSERNKRLTEVVQEKRFNEQNAAFNLEPTNLRPVRDFSLMKVLDGSVQQKAGL